MESIYAHILFARKPALYLHKVTIVSASNRTDNTALLIIILTVLDMSEVEMNPFLDSIISSGLP